MSKGRSVDMQDVRNSKGRLLEGIRVLDLSRVMSGPFCTAMLADLGAEVIKVEMPGRGDEGRNFGPFLKGESAYFMLLNRGKKGITIDLKSERGLEILKELVSAVDVLVENFRPGVANRLGIGYPELSRIHPGLVYASISGFGQDSPLANRPAYDLVIQAMSGLMSVTGQRDGPPTAVGDSIADVSAGMFAAWGIAAALFARERTGRGTYLDIAMLDSVYAMMLTVLSLHLYSERAPARVGSRHPVTYPVDQFEAEDGHVVLVVSSDRAFQKFAEAMEHPELGTDQRFCTNAARNENEVELKRIIENWTRNRRSEEIVEAMDAAGIPAARVLSIAEIAESPHIAARGMTSGVEHARFGTIPAVGQPVQIPGSVFRPQVAAPGLGEHTRDILASVLGYSDSEIQELVERKVIQTGNQFQDER